MKIQSSEKPYFDPVTAYVEMPPASLSATITMIPGPRTAKKTMSRRRNRFR